MQIRNKKQQEDVVRCTNAFTELNTTGTITATNTGSKPVKLISNMIVKTDEVTSPSLFCTNNSNDTSQSFSYSDVQEIPSTTHSS